MFAAQPVRGTTRSRHGSTSRTALARFTAVFALSVALVVCLGADASAAGPGGWDHLGDGGTPGTSSLNGEILYVPKVS